MPKDAFEALKNTSFSRFLTSRFFLTFSTQMQEVVVGWQVYQLTKDPFSLGMVGLSEAIPSIAVALFGGYLADRFNRKYIILVFTTVLLGCSLALWWVGSAGELLARTGVWPMYAIIAVSGFSRGLLGPSIGSFWPQLIGQKSILPNAVSWNSTIWQISATVGPGVGGLLIAPLGVSTCYLVDASIMAASVLIFASIRHQYHPVQQQRQGSIWKNFGEGLAFVRDEKAILGAITLDLFAVLFGGALALLPVFATEILHVGAFEFGLLKAATSIGSISIGLWLAYRPIRQRAGRILLASVAGFGVCIIVFGLSTSFWLSFVALILSGVFDGVSVVVRGTLLQTLTPDYMKGRVMAVNNIFIGSSNEIGAFESGLAAKIMGVVPSVVFGGCMSLLVVLIGYFVFVPLRDLDLQDG